LLTFLFAVVQFGETTYEDFQVLPEHGRYLAQIDHHGVIHVHFRADASVEDFVGHMRAKDYDLPTHPPDGTFKKALWMNR
jgi:hypothetical protein